MDPKLKSMHPETLQGLIKSEVAQRNINEETATFVQKVLSTNKSRRHSRHRSLKKEPSKVDDLIEVAKWRLNIESAQKKPIE